MLAGLNEPHWGLGIGAGKVARRTELEEEQAKERWSCVSPWVPPRCANHKGRAIATQGIPGADSSDSPLGIMGGGVRVVEGSCDRVVSQVWNKCVFWG